jgi:hypothetical protein
MTIEHFEDLPSTDILHFLEHINEYTATEKVDGSQLLFGIDEKGFYTSRETKGGGRVYDIAEYELAFHTTYRRMAHVALQSSLARLVNAGMKVDDQVEVEVLYGLLPNVIEYSDATNYLIFLRTTSGTVDINQLQSAFENHTLTVSLDVPRTDDGITICNKHESALWSFVRVPLWEYDTGALDENLKVRIEFYSEFLSREVTEMGISYADLLSIHLGRVSKYAIGKEAISKLRDTVRMYDTAHRLSMKIELLNSIVRNRPSNLGPTNGFIEGVVFTRPDGKMFKLVDKDLFREVQQFYWQMRNDKVFDTDELTIPVLDSNLDKYIKARKQYRLTVPFVDRIFKYSEPVHQRTLETFASKRRRILNETR